MARRTVTAQDLIERYGSCEDFVPDVYVRVQDARTKAVLRTDYLRVEEEDGIEYGYVPGASDPQYAKPPRGGWQCFEVHGLVKDWPVSFREIALKEEEGFVYFVQVGDSGPYKIGWSQDVERRIAQLQVANPGKLILRGTVPGTRETETEYHHRFRTARVMGEWFQNTDELKEFVRSLG